MDDLGGIFEQDTYKHTKHTHNGQIRTYTCSNYPNLFRHDVSGARFLFIGLHHRHA